jgi:uncharacterized protein DUF1707
MLFGPDLRASDADREAAVAFLKEHYEAGRLDHEEFGERVDAAYGARYESQLQRLTRDLPALRRTAVTRVRRPGGTRAVVAGGAVAFGAVVLATVPPVAIVLLTATLVTLLLAAGIVLGPLVIAALLVLGAIRALSRHGRDGLPRGHGGTFGH